MNCRQQIYDRMHSLNLYDLSAEKMSLVRCELESYLSVLEPLEKEILSVINNIFAESCELDRLTEFERMLGIPVNLDIPTEQRRKILVSKISLNPSDFHREGLERSLGALGIRAKVMEQPGGTTIFVEAEKMADIKMTLDQAKEAFRELMPAHLDAEFLTGGISFSQFDALDKTFVQLDAMDKSCSQLEMMREEQWREGK